jgi:acyl-CoA dehydrogenase
VGAAIGGHVNIATPPIWKFGSEDQKQRFLVPGIKGEKVGALGITEPGAGSDVAGLKTHAARVDGGWVVNGSKTFITNGVRADFVVTAVRTTPEGGHHGLSFFIIEKGMEGFSVSRKLEKLGWHASDTAELAFQDVFVPDENLLGQEHKGFYLIMANFQWERLGMALGAVGKMQYLLERALEYVGERHAFGRAIGKFQVTRHKVAEIALRLETSRALTYRALHLFTSGHDALRETTMAKLVTQRACCQTADDVLQLFGGNGYMREYEIERSFRDARLGPIGGGSDEIMREILGRQLGL